MRRERAKGGRNIGAAEGWVLLLQQHCVSLRCPLPQPLGQTALRLLLPPELQPLCFHAGTCMGEDARGVQQHQRRGAKGPSLESCMGGSGFLEPAQPPQRQRRGGASWLQAQ